MSEEGYDRAAKAIAELSSTMKTESRARILLTLREGPKRPTEMIRLCSEAPTTVYRAIDQLMMAGVVLREDAGDKVLWRLSPLGERAVDSILGVVEGKDGAGKKPRDTGAPYGGKAWYALPAGILVFAVVRAELAGQPLWVAGGAVLAALAYAAIRRLAPPEKR